MRTSLDGIYSGGNAARGGSTAIRATGDGQATAREIVGDIDLASGEIRRRVQEASQYSRLAMLDRIDRGS
jgi:glutamate synthase (NADPH/NADH) small chain